MKKIWKIAIYARVSTDKKEQQESIPAQVQSIEKWIIDKSKSDIEAIYNLVEIYEDAGFSGSDFERESFIRMKEDIEKGKINMIVTRDLSRFSRNYISAGYYIEDYFKVNGVRFISILDNVDTQEEINDIVPFKNILNEMYIKDCSKRVKDALRQRMIRGSCIASRPGFGYKFLEESVGNVKTVKLTPAMDNTTETVKEIFSLYLEGLGVSKLATYLNQKGVPPPSFGMKHSKAKFGLWTPSSIRSILINPKYGGIMAQQRYKKVSYKLRKIVQTTQEEWIIGDNFEGIVDINTYNEVQSLLKLRKKGFRNKGELHLFSSLLMCKECGGSMSYRKNYQGYKCTASQMGGKRCTSHSIKEEALLSRVREDLKDFAHMLDRDKFYGLIEEINIYKVNYDDELSGIDKQLNLLHKKLEMVYEDKTNGILNQKNFDSIIYGVQNKQEALEEKRREIEIRKHQFSNETSFSEGYKERINRILDMQDLDRFLLENLIESIIVSEDKGLKETKVLINYKFNCNNNHE
jgi:site-specific DNA recombinase